MNSIFQTPNLDDLNVLSDAQVNYTTTQETIVSGDHVVYFCEDAREYHIGIYLNLWYYITEGRETSPFVADNRVMAKIATMAGGVTYADVETIAKIISPVQSAKL